MPVISLATSPTADGLTFFVDDNHAFIDDGDLTFLVDDEHAFIDDGDLTFFVDDDVAFVDDGDFAHVQPQMVASLH